jgi:branched-chain amino acid transport system substrate-binding protein
MNPFGRTLALGACLTLSALGSAGAADGPFRIGVVLPKTGAYSQYGGFTEQGLRVGVKQANERGGINGRKIELIIRDDASNPGRSLLAAKDLLSGEGIDLLYPEIISGLALATLPHATEQKVVTISNGASPQIGDVSKFPFSFQYADLATQRLPALAAAMKKLGGQKVGILVTTNPPQVALGDALNAQLASKFGLPVAGYKQFTADTKDLTPLLQSLRDGGADIIAFSAAARDNVRVVMQGMQTLGWKAKVVTEPAALYGDLREQVPASVADQFFAINYRVGVRTGTPTETMKGFIDEMKAQGGPIDNLAISALARDVIFLAKWAFETAQKEKGNTSPESLKSVLESLGSRALPPGYLLVFENPGYSSTDHTTGNASYKNFWGLVRVSPLVDGTYEGDPLPLAP